MQSVEWTLPVLDSGALLSILVTLYYINHHIIFYIQHCDCFDIAVERYCPRTNEWQTVAPMHESRSPKILLILYHFFQSHCLFCYLCMNHQLPSPPSSYSSSFDRFGCAVVAHQGRIYVSGGFGQDKVNFPSHDYPDQSILNHRCAGNS